MSQQQRNQGFWRNTLDLIEQITDLKFSADVQKTMDHNFVWDRTNNPATTVWREFAGDSSGRARVTSGPTRLTELSPTLVTVQTSETLILDTNLNRQLIEIDNQSYWSFLIAFRKGDIGAGNSIQFPQDFSLEIDGYTGPIFGQAVNQTVSLKVLEV